MEADLVFDQVFIQLVLIPLSNGSLKFFVCFLKVGFVFFKTATVRNKLWKRAWVKATVSIELTSSI